MPLQRTDIVDATSSTPGKSAVTYPSPSISDLVVRENVPIRPEKYEPLPIGTPHPKNAETHLDLRLVWQGPAQGSDAFTRVQRIYATPRTAEDVFNYAIQFSGDVAACPIYVRSYLIKRADFVPATREVPLKEVIAAHVTAGGANYTDQTIATVSGGGGSGAVIVPILYQGAVVGLDIRNVGQNYTTTPVVTISDTGGGTGATGTLTIQIQTALLIKEVTVNLAADDPLYSTFLRVTRIYEVFPGPYLPQNRRDQLLGNVVGQKRAVIYTGQAASLTTTAETHYESRDDSAIVAWEIVEDWSANGGYPVVVDHVHDDDKGDIFRTTQLVVKASQVSTSVQSGSTIVKTDYIGYNPFLYKQVVETWAIPQTYVDTETNPQKQVVTVTRNRRGSGSAATITALKDVAVKDMGDGSFEETTSEIPEVFDEHEQTVEIPDLAPPWAKALQTTLVDSIESAATSITPSPPVLTTGQLSKSVRRLSKQKIRTQTTARDPATLPKTRTNKALTTQFGGGILDTVEILAEGVQTISPGGNLIVEGSVEDLGDGTSVKSTATIEGGNWPVLVDYDIDEETGQTILSEYQVVDVSAAATATVSSGVVTRYKHIDKWHSMKIVTTYSTPATYDEQRFMAHPFPSLFDGAYSWTPECGAFATGFRGAFSAFVATRVETSFSATKPAIIVGLTLIPKTLILGKGVQLPQDMLMDAGSFTYTGTCSGTISYGASDPSYSTYLGLIGSEQLISGEAVKTKGGLYRVTNLYLNPL